MSQKFFLALLAVLCAVSPSLAQTQSDDVVRITVNLVQIDAVVTKNGKSIKDLKAADFEIFEDGRRQEITSFAYVSNVTNNARAEAEPGTTSSKDPNAPANPNPPPPPPTEIARRRIALVVDDYGLSAQSMADVRRQLRKFIDEQLNPNDLIAIIRTSRARRELPHFTNDRSRINQAWEQVKWNQCSRVGVKPMPRIGDNASVGCGTSVATFNESISSLRAIVTALGQVPGRKSMIIFSDDTPLREDEKLARGSSSVLQANSTLKDSHNHNSRLKRLAEMAIRLSVVIYAVDTSGLQVIGITGADATPRPMVSGSEGNRLFVKQLSDRSRLIQSRRDGAIMITKETGGFLVHDQNDFQLDKILDEQGGYYLIGYRPSTETFNKQFHKLKARVKKDGFEVRTRSGFFGMSEEEAKQLKETSKQ
jgi:VWFA-related protein